MNEHHSHENVERTIGRVRTDDGHNNAAVEITVSKEGRKHFRRDLYVGIFDSEQNIEFIGRVVAGPFHRGGDDYAIEGTVEIMGQLEDARRIRPTATRPRPLSEVYAFEQERLQELLGMKGDFHMGRLAESGRVEVIADSSDKGFLPRNIGIFGTVGSGKSNTAQVVMEEALDAGWAVVVVDVEGEYARMNEPTDDRKLIELLDRNYGAKPAGVSDFKLFEPASGNSGADSAPFKVPISAMKPEVVSDILNFTDAQSRMFEAVTRSATGRNAYLNRQENRRSRVGAPGGPANGRNVPGAPARPAGSAPVATAIDAEAEADDESGSLKRPYNLQDLIDGLQESNQAVSLLPRIRQEDLPTAASLRTKLSHLAESGVVDSKAAEGSPELPIEDMLVGGRLTVVDVSESDDQSRNITIAYTLQALFEQVIRTPVGGTMPNGGTRPRLLVVIEEVHNFVSRAMAHRMRTVLDSLQIISRRGRKRWMALALISQQPNHVPDELFELANTRFIHQMKAVSNLDSLKQTTGGVHEALWSEVPVLGVGRCLVSGTIFNNPIFVDVRPAKTRRLFVH